MNEGSTINVLGTEFSGTESITEAREAFSNAVKGAIVPKQSNRQSKHRLGDGHAGFCFRQNQSGKPARNSHLVAGTEQTVDEEYGPTVLVSHTPPVKHGSSDMADRFSSRLAVIGDVLRNRLHQKQRPPQGPSTISDPVVAPWIHFHSTGVDVSPRGPIVPLARERERNCLVDRIIKAQSAGPSGQQAFTVVSLADAFFSVPLRTSDAEIKEDSDHEVIYMEPALASWCGAVCRARKMLESQSLRFEIETFPLDWLSGRNAVVIGVLVERISDERAQRLRRRLNELTISRDRTHLCFDVIPVKALGQNMGSVRTLSKDAFDAAFEAIRR
ncbi:hypothetical protein [Paraburkholderia phytofirmans]|uniref:hypothetical protein n=1 Tax=Paraburkholderia phytofirmans TaxID=261302 RepID=UPI0011E05FEA|nr:hypothetical protein [Paraburkholderia phytofirmans]